MEKRILRSPKKNNCACPKKECPNNGKCSACVKKHRESDSLTFCMFPDNDGNKSVTNYYQSLQKRFGDSVKLKPIKAKPIVDLKKCFASKSVCTAIKCCPVKAISYIDVDIPILDKTLNCNCNDKNRTGKIKVTCTDSGCDSSGCSNDLYSCGGTPYGRIIIDYTKCVCCGLCAKECCGSAIAIQ